MQVRVFQMEERGDRKHTLRCMKENNQRNAVIPTNFTHLQETICLLFDGTETEMHYVQ